MKSYVILEINSKKETLGNVEIKTPNQLIFSNSTEAIVNNRIFSNFIDEIFTLTITELQNDYDKKIHNVYVTFIGNNNTAICSFVLDRLRPRRKLYRLGMIDWESNGYKLEFTKKE